MTRKSERINYYLEYSSMIDCSTIFSGISARSGTWRKVPACAAPSQASQEYWL